MWTPGQARSRSAARAAQAASRCSQLSSTSSRRLGLSHVHQRLLERLARLLPDAQRLRRRPGAPGRGRTAGPAPPARRRRSTGPAGRRRPGARGGSCPLPPAPVSVSRRVLPSSALTSAISLSRPMKQVACWGRLLGRSGLSSERSGGKSAGRDGVQELEDALGPAQVLEAALAQVAQGGAGRQVRRGSAPGRASESRVCPPCPAASRRATRLSGGPK